MKKRLRNTIIFFLLLAFIVFWSVLLYFITPHRLVDGIGVQNGYILSFLFGVFGEAATFTALSYYPAIVTLAAGGLNPFILGLIAGTGMTMGNSIYFFFGRETRNVLSENLEKQARKVLRWVEGKPNWILQMIMFIYVGFTPFPNNLLTASGGITGVPFRKMILPLFLGNVVLTTTIAYITIIST
ncbi:hypothetical protein JW898_05420 [Candidatus Woesearchaeota archaeon]|nr:hypothetical protein [Candidatus Woesearchaeota archaeon]